MELRHIDWSPVYLSADVNTALARFNNLFLAVINKIAPYRDYRPKLNSKPWMCGEIVAAIKKRDMLFSRFKKDRGNVQFYRE